MSGVVPLRPYEEDDPAMPHRQTLQPQLAVGSENIFYCEHRKIESTFEISEINAMLLEIDLSLGFVPSDHRQNVYAI